MQRHVTLRLFRRGPAAEVILTFLVLLAIVLLFTDATWNKTNPVRQAISTTLYPFQRAVLFPRDILTMANEWVNAAALIKSENEALQRQRITLAQVSTNAALLSAENSQLRRLLGVLETAVDRPTVVVEVLYEPVNAFTRRIVFNKGSRAGIAQGMPVIDESGVVGQITRVTPMSSEAAMLTDEIVSIPVQVLRNGLRLIAFGSSSPGKVEVRYFSSDADIQEGDQLVTSGVGGVFPAGLAVGRIDHVERNPASGFARAEALPASHPERHRHFLVLQVPVGDGSMSLPSAAAISSTELLGATNKTK
ncbi:MAG: rod shape-determining protein MreC [Burkholderiaceae bacterium]|jgi:rod shape-determining protein MreC|nr:rod shape-determining protein MreC [Burkholderiaceae bacterium]MDP4968921.1 rod shape-determining protein MreC [Burkholderiaceae bacterium]MDP5110964.1 rod shape-determining protein MreC [Burkholderiaceae bacterium]